MITFNFASSQWANLTTVGLYSESGMALAGSSQFIPLFGKAGLIVMIGGAVPTSSWDTGGTGGPLRSMSNITIFDPYYQEWYSQTATGDVPAARRNFCLVGAMSINETTYEM
jgi:hypothetical protein